jgi:hypothetical protein
MNQLSRSTLYLRRASQSSLTFCGTSYTTLSVYTTEIRCFGVKARGAQYAYSLLLLLATLLKLLLDFLSNRLDSLLGAIDDISGGIVSLSSLTSCGVISVSSSGVSVSSLLSSERRKDVGLDLELVKLGRSKRGGG